MNIIAYDTDHIIICLIVPEQFFWLSTEIGAAFPADPDASAGLPGLFP